VTLQHIAEATKSGARFELACKELGLDARTVQRWKKQGVDGEDRRAGPRSAPPNKLTQEERNRVLEVVNSAEYRDLSPKQVVPKLADSGEYVASEATVYRLLREGELLTHRGRAKPRQSKAPEEKVATAPLQVWSWDITYLRSQVAGAYYYLYMHLDIWSRKIVGWRVCESESSELAASALESALKAEGISGNGLILHQDNGAPMKGATLKATIERLGVKPSYSRPQVSDDNPYSEATFRTLKYRPDYPQKPFASIGEAQAWVDEFVSWYNHEHLHSGIGFVSPVDRHLGRSEAVLKARRAVYAQARLQNPMRWSGPTRAWRQPEEVRLNSPRVDLVAPSPEAIAA
jgi:putative transposase